MGIILMIEKRELEKFIREEMKSKIARYSVFREVIYKSLTSVYEFMEKTKRKYTLLAYVRKTQDGFDENVLHIQMHFKNLSERDRLWNKVSEKLVENINSGMKKVSDSQEKLEIENILCSIRSKK